MDTDQSNTIVFHRGYVGSTVKQLEQDMRVLLEPNVARRLRVRRTNSLRDFVDIAPALHVGQLLCLSSTEKALYLRLIRMASGPTLTFRVAQYSLLADVARGQRRPAPPTPLELAEPPLLVLSNFRALASAGEKKAYDNDGNSSDNNSSSSSSSSSEDDEGRTGSLRVQLLTQVFQQMFPTLDPANTPLSSCRRVVLVAYSAQAQQFEVRHYRIMTRPVGVSRGVKKALSRRARLPDLSQAEDISQLILDPSLGLSDSEGELGSIGDGVSGTGNNNNNTASSALPSSSSPAAATQKAAVRLHELGPRLTLELVKIEEGVSSGAVLYHSLVHKSAKEMAKQERQRRQREQLRARRREEQEENVQRKKAKKHQQKK